MKTLITCHSNADYDAFSSMLAIRHLFAGSILLYPGSQEKKLQKIFSELEPAEYGLANPGDIDWSEIEHLVIVDTAQKSRLKHAEKLLENNNISIEIWDHHPMSADDLEADIRHIKVIGSTTALIVKALDERGISLSPPEATLIGLGIYGDTGSFTYSSTTPEDFQAAAWLLRQGMDVNRISDLAAHELTSVHIHALDKLLESAKRVIINDLTVILAEVSLDHYLGDFAHIAQKFMELEKFDALFAIGAMVDRIQIVARSRSEKIDVGKICSELGGGGHAFAASVSLKNRSTVEVRELITQTLYLHGQKEKQASDFMSAPPVGIVEGTSIRSADELMLHFGLKSVPVFQEGTRRCTGIIEARMTKKALLHGLGNASVDEYMIRRIFTAPPTASIRELASIIVGRQQRLVPIVLHDEAIGVVSRTDLINVLAEEKYDEQYLESSINRRSNIAGLMRDRLPARVQKLLKMAGELGRQQKIPVYVVGGFVRDLLLGRPNNDIDLVVEGNGIGFANRLAQSLKGRVREHKKFLTSVILYPGEHGEERIDVATARLEYYESPASLPIVELSSIKKDLFRRDFSINSLAIRLDAPQCAQLIDFFGGRRDLKDRIVRVLHTLSFVEDPTRCLRAIRFEQRYNFRIGSGTEKLIRNSISMEMMGKLSPQRIFNEYAHICEESDPPACFSRMDELGLMNAILPHRKDHELKKHVLERCHEMHSWYNLLYFEEKIRPWFLYFLALTHNFNYRDAASSYDALGLPQAKKNQLLHSREQMRAIRQKLGKWQKDNENSAHPAISELYNLLLPLSLECLVFMMATNGNEYMEMILSRFITSWRQQKPDIGGEDLKRLGLAPGPEYTLILAKLLSLKLNGIAPDAESQMRELPRILKDLGLPA